MDLRRGEDARRLRTVDLAAATIVHIQGTAMSKGHVLNLAGLYLSEGLTRTGALMMLPGPEISVYGMDIGDPQSIGTDGDVEYLAMARKVALALTSTRFVTERA